jgi:6-phosphogluconolactonase
MSPEVIVDKPERLAARLVERFEEAARPALAASGRFAVALPGGSVAAAFFPALAAASLPWARTDVFWGDERAVPPDDPHSNFRAARRLLLEPAGVPPARIHRMPAEEPDLEAAARAYEEEMVRVMGRPPRLDLALLGLGPDGHVCSLFPGHPLLGEEGRWVAAIHDSPKPPSRRLTLTLPALEAAHLVIVAAGGAGKAAAVGEALTSSASSLPVALVARRASRAVFLLDREAARLVSRT